MFKNSCLIITVFIASLGGLLSGYDTGVISGAMLYINETWVLTDVLQGFLVASVLIGAVLGAFVNGFLSDILGRKKIIMMTGIIFVFGSLFCAFAPSIKILIFSRILVGFAVGAVAFTAPLYLSEISPKKHRGMIITLFQWAITFGILFAYFINAVFANSFYNWRWMLGAGLIPGIILFAGMCFLSDTPRWLISKGRFKEAEEVLLKVNKDCDVKQEIENIKNTFSQNNCNIITFIFNKKMLKPFVIGVGIMFIQICTGINNIIYYAPSIFKNLGAFSNLNAIYATVGIGVVNFLATIIALFTTDKLGRKPLLYIGLSGMTLTLFILSASFLPQFSQTYREEVAFLSIIIYVICFAMSLGPVAFTIISEVFPLKVRGLAMSLCVLANYTFNFMTTASFPVLLNKTGGSFTFAIFGVIGVISIIFTIFVIPETKGLSLEEIENKWG